MPLRGQGPWLDLDVQKHRHKNCEEDRNSEVNVDGHNFGLLRSRIAGPARVRFFLDLPLMY
jgi:hypothetical protein